MPQGYEIKMLRATSHIRTNHPGSNCGQSNRVLSLLPHVLHVRLSSAAGCGALLTARGLPLRLQCLFRSSCHDSAVPNPTSIHKDTGSIPGLTQWVKDHGIAVSCGVGCRRSSDPALLWLWRGPAYSSNSTPSLGTSICRGSCPRSSKKTKK